MVLIAMSTYFLTESKANFRDILIQMQYIYIYFLDTENSYYFWTSLLPTSSNLYFLFWIIALQIQPWFCRKDLSPLFLVHSWAFNWIQASFVFCFSNVSDCSLWLAHLYNLPLLFPVFASIFVLSARSISSDLSTTINTSFKKCHYHLCGFF